MDGRALFDGSSRACGGGGGEDGLSRRQAATRFGVSDQHGDQLDEAGREDRQRCAGPDRRSQAEDDFGEHRDWLVERCRERDFTLRGLVAELAERGLKVDYRSVWDFVHAEKLSLKKDVVAANGIVPTWRGGGPNGAEYQNRIDPARLVFIDETWTKTNMAPLRGWAPRGERLRPRCLTATGRP